MIRIYINDEPHIIEMCEGQPEIRHEGSAKSAADRRITVYPFSCSGSDELKRASVRLRVEAV